jgi:hypothetical protein
MAIAGHEIGRALCDALGLPKRTRAFTLRAEVGALVSVECEYYPEGAGLVTALAEYELAQRETAAEPTQHPAGVMGFDAWMRERTETAHAELMARGARGGIEYNKRILVNGRRIAVDGIVPSSSYLVGAAH